MSGSEFQWGTRRLAVAAAPSQNEGLMTTTVRVLWYSACKEVNQRAAGQQGCRYSTVVPVSEHDDAA